jgi:osmotically-inducible protein OsmY
MLAAGMLNAHAAGTPVRAPSDTELARRVSGVLNATIGVRSREIEVIVLGGVVSLYGQVATSAAREAAISATERTPGVRGVADNLSIGAGR